jgi:hypothetical protein
MYRKLMYAMVISLLAVASATTQGATFTDNFDKTRDYVKDGVAGTGWDGFLGLGAGETVTALTTMDAGHPGQLYIASGNDGRWQEPWTTLPPFLYKVVTGDFIATVKVTDYAGTAAAGVLYNNAALMARAAVGSVGTGENWVSIDYFPLYNCGNFVRSATNNVRAENGNNGKAWNLDPWLQLERVGNVFHLRTSVDGATWTEMAASPRTRNDLAGIPVEVGLTQCTYSTNVGYAAFDNFTLTGPGVVPPNKAFNANPASQATDVLRTAILSWTPNEAAVKSDVYFGTSLDAVTAASRTNQQGVLVSQAQDANTYDPAGLFAYGQTYYWRIDGINASGAIIAAGEIWSFTVEPLGYAIAAANITATASTSDKDKGPELTINGSGMTGDLHGIDPKTMWNTTTNGAKTAWIQYSFDKVYKMYELWVWNYNSEVESLIGFGLKNVTVQYSTDGTNWTALGDFEFTQAQGAEGYAHDTTISFGGVPAKQIKLIVNSTWSAKPTKAGLSEVRFLYTPVWAREPKPATASTNIDPAVTLSWRAGREAASHNVYIGTDSNAVRDRLVAPLASSVASYTPSSIDLGTTYYWMIEEVNAATTPTAWPGTVWSFATPTYITVEDFESYNDKEGTSVFNTWTDGYNTTTNGAQVGYGNPANGTFNETTVIHGGRQAMPFTYGTGNITTSETTRTFANAQDWTRAGIKTLVIFFRGATTNATGQLYVKINGTKVNYAGDASILAKGIWKQWNVDLTTLTGLKAVKTLVIGVTGAGQGVLLFDDIRLYKTAPAITQPTDPGTTNLMANFTMEGEVKDVSGHGYVGTLNNVTFTDSMAGFGKAAQFNGTTAYVDMGSTFSTSLLRNLTSCTFAVWVNYSTTANQWARVFDFGNAAVGTGNPTTYMFITTRNGNNAPRFAITTTGTAGESTASGTSAPAAGWHHLAAVVDATTMRMAFYVDGTATQTNRTTTLLPKDLGATTQNWLGRSQYSADAYLNGAVDDFRIYNRALTAGEVGYLAGDR